MEMTTVPTELRRLALSYIPSREASYARKSMGIYSRDLIDEMLSLGIDPATIIAKEKHKRNRLAILKKSMGYSFWKILNEYRPFDIEVSEPLSYEGYESPGKITIRANIDNTAIQKFKTIYPNITTEYDLQMIISPTVPVDIAIAKDAIEIEILTNGCGSPALDDTLVQFKSYDYTKHRFI